MKIAREHLAVAALYAVRMGKVVQVMNGFVQLGGIELTAGPAGLEIPKAIGHFFKVVSFVPVEIGTRSSLVQIGHHPTDQVVLIPAVFIPPLAGIGLAISIIRIAGLTILVSVPRLRFGG